jgi:hypothetical protein
MTASTISGTSMMPLILRGRGKQKTTSLMTCTNYDISGDDILDVGHTTHNNVSDIVPDVGQQAASNIPDTSSTAYNSTGEIVSGTG